MRKFSNSLMPLVLLSAAATEDTAGDTTTDTGRLTLTKSDGTTEQVNPQSGAELAALLKRLGRSKKDLPTASEMANALADAVRTGDVSKAQALATNLVQACNDAASLNVLMSFPGSTNCRVGNLDVNARAGVNAIVGEDKTANKEIRAAFVPKSRS